jgi:phosphatidylserine/phosphatidylglycerophosphate/cardiolipin synthase-like enzyme
VLEQRTCVFTWGANFTQRAQERNTECGVLIEDPTFAHHLSRQWLGLAGAGLMIEANK